ncbi:putative integral membrane protein [Neisseria meningitidis NM3001]|nr:putative integral membrane protein [Neisseria meningitidis NM3001]ELK67645.1 putative membrane protein [Neisseria meningitidis 97021]ELK74077.1 putative membrane protein [Neisseria meningitidis 2006087]ELK78134.1 putative membrane protein [Neisseria meningitidis 2002038]ELK79860.1 putative membrane protein [Neisseria meningitidis 97014]EOC53237.1 putative membrane protein [Neisseria meningitidis 2005172]EOC54378.1 putative membrane protein [Neisseria meningitidis 2008223]EPF57084.1 putati
MHSHYIFGILMISYVFAMLFNFIISYKIFKEEKLMVFFDFLIKSSYLNFKYFNILFGKEKISNIFYLKLLRINLALGVFILSLIIINIFCL